MICTDPVSSAKSEEPEEACAMRENSSNGIEPATSMENQPACDIHDDIRATGRQRFGKIDRQ